jgi:hypothetical protein
MQGHLEPQSLQPSEAADASALHVNACAAALQHRSMVVTVHCMMSPQNPTMAAQVQKNSAAVMPAITMWIMWGDLVQTAWASNRAWKHGWCQQRGGVVMSAAAELHAGEHL